MLIYVLEAYQFCLMPMPGPANLTVFTIQKRGSVLHFCFFFGGGLPYIYIHIYMHMFSHVYTCHVLTHVYIPQICTYVCIHTC